MTDHETHEPTYAQVNAAARALLPLLDETWPYYEYDEMTAPGRRSDYDFAVGVALRAAFAVDAPEVAKLWEENAHLRKQIDELEASDIWYGEDV